MREFEMIYLDEVSSMAVLMQCLNGQASDQGA